MRAANRRAAKWSLCGSGLLLTAWLTPVPAQSAHLAATLGEARTPARAVDPTSASSKPAAPTTSKATSKAVPRGSSKTSGPAKAWLVDRIIAVVGPRVILQSELAIELQISPLVASRLMALGGGRPSPETVAKVQKELEPAVLDALIGDQLILLEGEKYPTLALSDAELQSYLVNIAQGNNLGTVDKLREEVERSGQYGGWAQYRKTMRRQVGVYKVQVSLVPSAEVSDAEVLAHYRELGRGEDAKVVVHRWVFGGDAAQSKAQAALRALKAARLRSTPDPLSDSDRSDTPSGQAKPGQAKPGEAKPGQSKPGQTKQSPAASEKEAQAKPASPEASVVSEQVLQRLKAALPGGRELVITRGNAAPVVEEALFMPDQEDPETMRDIVGPLRVGAQWLIFAVRERQASKLAAFAEVKEQLRAKLQQERREKEIKSFRERLRAKTHVDIRL